MRVLAFLAVWFAVNLMITKGKQEPAPSLEEGVAEAV